MAEFQILDHLEKLEPDGGRNDPKGDYSYLCPVCGSSNFKVNVKTGKWGTFGCECGNNEEGKRKIRNSLSPAKPQNSIAPVAKPIRPKAKRQWTYTNAEGTEVLQVNRTDDGNGERKIWQKSLINGQEASEVGPTVLPYGYAEAIQALEDGASVVLWVEGESCVDAVQKLGLPAVTSLGGSGQFNPDRDGGLFPADRLVVVPDRDQPGIKHADDIAAAYPGCRWLCPFPGSAEWNGCCPPNGGLDIADWIEQGATVEQITNFIGPRPDHLHRPTDDAAPEELDDDLELRQEALNRFREAQAASIDLTEVFGPFWGQRLIERAEAFPCDPVMLLLPMLGYVSSLVGNKASVRVKGGWSEPLIVWGMIAQPPSSLKSPAGGVFGKPLAKLQGESSRAFAKEHDAHKAKEKRWKAECRTLEAEAKREKTTAELPEPPQPPTPPRHYYFDSVTIERLAAVLAQPNVPGTICFHDELAKWFGSLDRKGNQSDRPTWLNLWTGGALKHDTQTGVRAFAESTAVSIVGFIQPDKLAQLIAKDEEAGAAGDGLWARFLPAIPRTIPFAYNDLEIDLTDDLVELARQLDNISPETTIGIGPGAMQQAFIPAWERWSQQEGESSASRASSLGKLRGYSVRLAGILHVLHHNGIGDIDQATATTAVRLCEFFLAQFDQLMPQVSETGDVSPTTAKFLQRVKDRGMTEVRVRDLNRWKLLGRHSNAKECEQFLRNLAAGGIGTFEKVHSKGSAKGAWAWKP